MPRLIAGLLQDPELPCPARAAWGDTRLELPAAFAGRELVNHLTDRPVPTSSGALMVGDLLADLPVALLVAPDLPSS